MLSQPICPHIFFAGEHTHSSRHGTVQGAYLSGLQAAEQVLKGCQAKPEMTNVDRKVVKEKTIKKSVNITRDEL